MFTSKIRKIISPEKLIIISIVMNILSFVFFILFLYKYTALLYVAIIFLLISSVLCGTANIIELFAGKEADIMDEEQEEELRSRLDELKKRKNLEKKSLNTDSINT